MGLHGLVLLFDHAKNLGIVQGNSSSFDGKFVTVSGLDDRYHTIGSIQMVIELLNISSGFGSLI